MKNVLWFARTSLLLDWRFLIVSSWSIFKKINFIILKYLLIIKHFVVPFTLGRSYTKFSGETIYYDSKFGVAGYQRTLTTHQKLIRCATNVNDISVIVDIGANVGYFSKLCQQMFPHALIYAIEPIEQIYHCLVKNFAESSGDVKAFQMALSDKQGKAKMRFNPDSSAISQISETGEVDVEVETLDNFSDRNKIDYIDILKIDTETFEAHVLRGARNILKNVRYLFIEVTMRDNPNYTLSSLMRLLHSDDYDFQLVSFRNYADVDEGEMPTMDVLLENLKYKK